METAVFLAVLASALAVAVAARSGVVPLSGATVPAAAPWAGAAACVVVAARAGIYGLSSVPLPTAAALAAGAALAVGAWLGAIQLAVLRDVPYRERYLSAAGFGAVAVVAAALAAQLPVPPTRLAWLFVAVGVAALFGALGYLGLGFVYPEALAELDVTGLYLLATVAFEGSASAVAAGVFGYGDVGLLTRLVGAGLRAGGLVVSEWLFLPVHTFVGAAVVALCGYLERYRRPLGYGAALLVSVAALVSGGAVLLSAVLLG
jgi:uncharacterized membrane protein